MANFSTFVLAEQQVNSKGAKFCPLSANGDRVHFTLGDKSQPLYSQFGPSSFDQQNPTGRCNLEFIADAKLTTIFGELDR